MLVLVVVIVLVLVTGLVAMVLYNGLVAARNKVEGAWAQIDVQLTRRAELIPNLVETVKGYAAHEQATLDAVINARNAVQAADGPAASAQADNLLTGALKSVFALAEAYPDLKANQNFLALQAELSGTEDKIAVSRQGYNSAVQQYNTKIQTVPASVIAGMFSFTEREYYEAPGDARGPVAVQF